MILNIVLYDTLCECNHVPLHYLKKIKEKKKENQIKKN